MSTLEDRIERVAARLATLKAQAQAREARKKAQNQRIARQQRTRALLLWGVALEREVKSGGEARTVVRVLLEKNLLRSTEREAAMLLLNDQGEH